MICKPEDCASHEYVTDAVKRIEGIADKLAESQQQLQMSVVKLTEQIEGIKRAHERVDVIEKNQGELQKFMYKATGGIASISFLVPIALKYILT